MGAGILITGVLAHPDKNKKRGTGERRAAIKIKDFFCTGKSPWVMNPFEDLWPLNIRDYISFPRKGSQK
jgi:hypothetical protein